MTLAQSAGNTTFKTAISAVQLGFLSFNGTYSNSTLADHDQLQDTNEKTMITFSAAGLPQPPGLVDITKADFEAEFGEIPELPVRRQHLASWNQWMADLLNVVTPDSWTQWLGGSFTTQKPQPGDIDVVNLIDWASSKELDISNTPYFKKTNDPGSCSKVKYNIDSFLLPVYPAGDPRHKVTAAGRDYWKKWLGKSRTGEQRSVFQMEAV